MVVTGCFWLGDGEVGGAYGAFGFEGLGVGGVVGGELGWAGGEGGEEGFGEAEFRHGCCWILGWSLVRVGEGGVLCWRS